MRVFSCLAGALALLFAASGAAGQWPGEVRGRAVDAITGLPVPAVEVTTGDRAAAALSDARGAFLLRGLEPGPHELRAVAPGYDSWSGLVQVENGRTVDLTIRLVPRPMEVEGVVASVARGEARAFVLEAEEIRALPATTAGDVAATVPGVRIEERGRGSAQVPAIRGSSGDAVLVLVDGVPINDPVTGEADLSTVPASALASLRVLPGGQSARYGARAEGGVILVETGAPAAGSGTARTRLAASVGSLGERSLQGALDRSLGGGTLGASASLHRYAGSFDFEIPAEAGGGEARRENAGVRSGGATLSWAAAAADGAAPYRLTVAGERLERGLPGRSFAPSRTAEQALDRLRASGSMDLPLGAGGSLGIRGHWMIQRVEHADPEPPFGEPFDERATMRSAGAELRTAHALPGGASLGAGASVRSTRVDATQLVIGTAADRLDAGGWLTASWSGPAGLALTGTARLDRSGLPTDWYVSHDLGLSWGRGAFLAHVGHRSSFSPPTLGDQFFREGVGVEPNPELEAERVPSEWVAGAALEMPAGGALLGLEAEAYVGDVEGMIVWLPDYRFVWSPRNRDVRRRGLEASARLRLPGAGLDVRAHAAWNRTTWARGAEDVQVVYRPERTAAVVGSWTGGGWSASVAAAYTGARNPVPNPVNRLPGFWTVDTGLARRARTRWGLAELRLDVERLLDNEEGLIFAFPDPGRTLRLTLRLER